MARRPSVLVLMSTFNGAAFLAPQIDSVLGQRGVDVTLRVRDDGSTDATPALLADYAARDARVQVVAGGNLGAPASFLTLLGGAEPGFDALAFADQDDWWYPDKLARAADALARVPAGTPAAYCARVALADADLQPLGDGPLWRRGPAFGNALVENVAIGCTLAMTDAARAALAAPGGPPAVGMHDWLVYQVVAGSGRVLYDPRAVLLYRQHGANAVGAGTDRLRRLARTAARMSTAAAAQRIHAQNAALRTAYRDRLRPEAAALLDRFLDRPDGRLKLAADRRIFRQNRIDDAAMRLLIAAGRL